MANHPAFALIRNVGFGVDATHTFGKLDQDYFYEGNDLMREEWIASLRYFLDSPNALPPFIREVSDLAYLKPSIFQTIKSLCKKMLNTLRNLFLRNF